MSHQDEDLFRRAESGDEPSLDALLARYLPQLHAYVHLRLSEEVRARESSMDIVQSVCRELLSERGRFEFRGEERFRAWLFTAALNRIRDKYRFHRGEMRDVRREEPGSNAFDEVVARSLGGSPSRGAMAAETSRMVREAIAALSEDHREVVTLTRIVGLPHRVIAEVMGRSEAATRQLLGRALVELSQELQKRGLIEE